MTAWVNDTPEGRAAWRRSSEDYNIGDLVSDLHDPSLQPRLSAAQIVDLSVECFADLTAHGDWTYDTVLVNDYELDLHR